MFRLTVLCFSAEVEFIVLQWVYYDILTINGYEEILLWLLTLTITHKFHYLLRKAYFKLLTLAKCLTKSQPTHN